MSHRTGEPTELYVVAGNPRRAWCDRCATSAALTVDVYVLAAEGPARVSTVARCGRCDDDTT